ncbi:MAG: ferredoxin [Acidimicrobiales bacterium]
MPEPAGRPAISIDRDQCIGSGLCVVYAPGTFANDDEAKAVVVDPRGDPIESLRVAVEACPTGALRLVVDEQAHQDADRHQDRHQDQQGQEA